MVSFSDLGVSRELVRALANQGIHQPFEVQTESIPDGMLGNDLCCRAPTGSGKTLAFGLPLIERTRPAEPGFPTSLILTPTRELAEQIHGLKVDSRTTVIDLVTQNDTFRTMVQGTIRGAKTVRINPTGDDTYETVLEIDREIMLLLLREARSIKA